MSPPNPSALARFQSAVDTRRTRWRPELLVLKRARMDASPAAFLRGAAPLFYECLRRTPPLARGPRGTARLCGDLHLENFGAFKGETGVAFGINDFDDTLVGPVRLDVLRLLTSTLLVALGWGARASTAMGLGRAVLDGHAAGWAGARRPPRSRTLDALVDAAARRKHLALLEARTAALAGRRRFRVGDDRYLPLSRKLASSASAAFGGYARRLEASGSAAKSFRVIDVALRIAGTGSLGALRIAVLTRGRGPPDGEWLFEMKEEGVPAGARFAEGPPPSGASRVVDAFRACLPEAPPMLGTARLGRKAMLVRRLTPQKDRVEAAKIPVDDREETLRTLGWFAGDAHRRGGQSGGVRWTTAERSRLLENARTLSGLHVAAFLASAEDG